MLSSPFACGIARPVLRTTAAIRLFIWIILCHHCLVGVHVVAAYELPYIPTTILLPHTNPASLQQQNASSSDVAYIFSPQGDSAELLALNISGTVVASSVPTKILSSRLPFIAGNSTAFAPAIAGDGSIIVYAGCCSTPNNASVWTFDIKGGDEVDWVQQSSELSSNSIPTGPSFLGASLAFSTILAPVRSTANVYVYGGMCPKKTFNETSSDGVSPQSMATYSNQMVKLSPSESSSSAYSIDSVENKGPPIPEAGFTFTGLTPSISNRSGTITQQINYVVLGGHNQQAYVNMSTAAIWSLPEESWAFVNIRMAGSGTSRTEFAIKSTDENVDSRSGHTAVLNEDGSALVILGGWVGNPPAPASPQLAILEIGAEYGGDGNWQWSIPDSQPSGSGIYGHGATLLPGNVMMVYGGYDIPSSGESSKRQTSTSSSSSNVPMFLNLTSVSWSDNYVHPAYTATSGSSSSDNSIEEDDEAKRRLGLGLGLGLGLAAVLAAIGALLCYRRRTRHRYEAREEAIRALAQDNDRFYPSHEAMMERDDGDPFMWYTGGHDPYMGTAHTHSLGYESLRNARRSWDAGHNMGGGTVRFMDTAKRSSIAPRAAKGHYQPTPTNYDPPSGSRPRGPGFIHPIAEADEDSDHPHADEPGSPTRDANRDSAQYSDPFVTPTSERPMSFPSAVPNPAPAPAPEPKPTQATDPEVQDWMEDVDAADALLSSRKATRSGSRSSPKRRDTVKSNRSGYMADDDGRTESNISESNRSNFSRSGSIRSHIRNSFGLGASTTPTATAAAAAAAEAAAAATTTTEAREGTSSSNSSAPSWNTAKSSFPALQAEGPSLLLGRNQNNDNDNEPGSPSKMKLARRTGWLGSLRRVFSGPTPSPSPPGSERESPAHDSLGEASDFDPRLGGLGGIAAGGLLKRRGGRGAWAAEASSARDGGDEDEDDEEWDVEKEVEKRLVQVMFTVPKERLRVVNGEPDIESGEDVVVVDPDKDDLSDDFEKVAMPLANEYELEGERPHHGLGLSEDPEKEALGLEEATRRPLDKGKQRETIDTLDSGLGTEIAASSHLSRASEDLLTATEEQTTARFMPGSPDVLGLDRQMSRFSQLSDADILSAEAVRLERPRSKVLAMVENIESRSRSASPDRPA